MHLSKKDRRAIIAMCCTVARADGFVSAGEFEYLMDILGRLSRGSVTFGELQSWLDDGPPSIDVILSEDLLQLFLHEAVAVAHADGQVDESEIWTIKSLVRSFFDRG